jgi:hypothetical protein
VVETRSARRGAIRNRASTPTRRDASDEYTQQSSSAVLPGKRPENPLGVGSAATSISTGIGTTPRWRRGRARLLLPRRRRARAAIAVSQAPRRAQADRISTSRARAAAGDANPYHAVEDEHCRVCEDEPEQSTTCSASTGRLGGGGQISRRARQACPSLDLGATPVRGSAGAAASGSRSRSAPPRPPRS